MNKALIVVDYQYDFIEGALAVPGADELDFQRRLAEYVAAWDENVAFSRDWHPEDHVSFADGEPTFTDGGWPAHCVQGTVGAEIMLPVTGLIISKGIDTEAYSAFDGDVDLIRWLNDRDIGQVEVVGLALDYCVKATALDAALSGFDTTVLVDLTLPVAEQTGIAAMAELRQAGVKFFDTTGTPR